MACEQASGAAEPAGSSAEHACRDAQPRGSGGVAGLILGVGDLAGDLPQLRRDRGFVGGLDNAGGGTEAEFFPRQVRTWADNPEQLYSAAERRRLVEQGMLRLPAKYRVVLVLRDIEQLSTEEAAIALGLGIPAIKSRLCRARLMLREALAPHFIISSQSELTRIGL